MAKVADLSNEKTPNSSRFKQTGIDKWFNIILCRSDLNNESLDNQPVSFVDLVSGFCTFTQIFYPSSNMVVHMTGFWFGLELFWPSSLA
jgi:hypothetical protein